MIFCRKCIIFDGEKIVDALLFLLGESIRICDLLNCLKKKKKKKKKEK